MIIQPRIQAEKKIWIASFVSTNNITIALAHVFMPHPQCFSAEDGRLVCNYRLSSPPTWEKFQNQELTLGSLNCYSTSHIPTNNLPTVHPDRLLSSYVTLISVSRAASLASIGAATAVHDYRGNV